MDQTSRLDCLTNKIEARVKLCKEARRALLNLKYQLLTAEAGRYISREGETGLKCCLILSGLAYKQKVTVDGSRQILSINIPGDFVDIEGSIVDALDHSVQALTRCEIAIIARADIDNLLGAHPEITKAFWIDSIIEGSISREWTVNIGRRDARTRVAHLLCEFARRMEAAGLGRAADCELPMTQEQLADAVGLTQVHVNRTLRALERDGLIRRERRFIAVHDWRRLRETAGFSELYLHLEQQERIPGSAAEPARR